MTHDEMRIRLAQAEAEVERLQAEIERQGGMEDMAAAGVCQRATEEI